MCTPVNMIEIQLQGLMGAQAAFPFDDQYIVVFNGQSVDQNVQPIEIYPAKCRALMLHGKKGLDIEGGILKMHGFNLSNI